MWLASIALGQELGSPNVRRLPPVSIPPLGPSDGRIADLPPLEEEEKESESEEKSEDDAEADDGKPPVPPGMKRDLGGPLGNAIVGPRRAPFAAQTFWVPATDLPTQPGKLTLNGFMLNGAAPLSVSEGGLWLATGNVNRIEIGSSAILPDSKLPMPDQLWQINLGTLHFRELSNGWQAGGLISVGSASDQAFAAIRDMTLNTALFVNVPRGERDAWNFSLFYSPTAQIVFPIPGVAYIWRPNDAFQANIGIPAALAWKPTEKLAIVASYTPLTNVRLQVHRQLGEHWTLYGGYQIDNEIYFLADRLVDDQRFNLFDQVLKLGILRKVGLGFSLDFSAGYVFDREFFQSVNFAGSRTDVVPVDPGVMGGVQLLWTR